MSVVATQEIADAVVRLAEVKAEQEKLEADADALSLAIRTCMAEASELMDSSRATPRHMEGADAHATGLPGIQGRAS